MARTLSPAGHRPAAVQDLDHALALASVAIGAVGLLLVVAGVPAGGVVVGAVGMVVALWGQMVSRTRPERFVDMAGLLVSFLALATGFAEGGL